MLHRGEKLGLAAVAWGASCIAPIAMVGVAWAPGWRAFPMAAKDALSIVIAPGDSYVHACLAASVCNALFWLALLTAAIFRRARWAPRVMAAGALFAGGYALLALVDASLLGGVHLGAALWLAGPALVLWATAGRARTAPAAAPAPPAEAREAGD